MPRPPAGTIEFLTAALLLAVALPEEKWILGVSASKRKGTMIIQVLGEDLYWVDEMHAPMFASMGRTLVEAIQRGNPLLFSTLLHELVQFVHTQGQPVLKEESSVPDLEIPTLELLFPAFTE